MAPRVLVCAAERHLVRLLQVNLQRQGYVVTPAYGGREAIERLKAEPFDLAVIDRRMPEVDGLAVLAWIRGNDATKDLPVRLMGTPRDEDPPGPGDEPPNPTAGANLWLTRPLNPAPDRVA